MEIKTCEQYVLAQLDAVTRMNEHLTERFLALSKATNEIFLLINPHYNGDNIEFNSVEATKYLEKMQTINRIINGVVNEEQEHKEEPDRPVALEEDKQEEQE